MIRAVVFDFDGVLANSEPLHFAAFRDIAAEAGLTLTEPEYYDRYLGYDDIGAFRAMAADAGRALTDDVTHAMVARKAVRMEALEGAASVLFPGARAAVARMAEVGPIAIASGALRAEIVRILNREALHQYFPVIVAAGDTPASKPDPAPYALAVERLAEAASPPLGPAHCVAVEDSRWGLLSAKGAGLHTIAITQSYPASQLGDADLIIDHLDELTPQLLTRLRR